MGGRFQQTMDRLGVSSRDVAVLLGAGLAGGAVFAARAVFQLANSSIEAASALEEQRSATEVLFEANSELVKSFAESAAALGFSERAALSASNQFGQFFENAGLAEDAAAKLGVGFVALAADTSSLLDLPVEDVIGRLISGLRGETDAVERLNVDVLASTVTQRAIAEGFGKTADEISEGEKKIVRALLEFEDLAPVYGDLSRTADSLANRQRRLNAEWENSKAALGEALKPLKIWTTQLSTDALNAVNGLLGGMEELNLAIEESGEKGTDVFSIFGSRTLSFRRHIEGELTNPWRRFLDVIDGYTVGGKDAADTTDEIKGAIETLNDPTVRAAVAFEDMTKATEDLAKAQDKLATATERASDAETRLNRAFEDFELRTDKAERSLTEAREDRVDREKEGRQRLADVMEDSANRVRDARERLSDFTLDAAERERTAERRLVDLREEHTSALARGQRAIEAAMAAGDAEAENEARIAFAEEQRNRAVKDAEIDLKQQREDDARDLDRLERDLDEARLGRIKDVKRAKEDLAKSIEDADERIEEAERGVEDAYRDSRRAVDDATEALAEANKEVRELTKEVDAHTASIKAQEEAQLRLAEAIGNTTEKYAEFRELWKEELGFPGGEDGGLGVFGPSDPLKLEDWLQGNARGGYVPAGEWRLVGEEGPEPVFFGSAATVVPNDQLVTALKQAAGGIGGGGATVNIYPQTADGRVIANEVAYRLGQGINW